MSQAWIRLLEVHLVSTKLKRKFVFGRRESLDGSLREQLNIDVIGYKYMSSLKDSCTIRIDNLTYTEVVSIIKGQYYDVEVKCGYRSSGLKTIFKGGVLYISNSLNSDKTNTIIILCASQMIAKYGQSRLNLSLNSGINLYSAINFACKKAGIKNANISSQFKKKFLQDTTNVDNTIASWLDKLAQENESYIVNSDSIADSTFSIFDATLSNQRVIKLKNDFIDLVGGYPQLTNQGLSLSIMPTFSFLCGDVIEIDNSLISLPVQDKSELSKNYGYFLDKDGQYMIIEQSFHLQNRGASFSITLSCKARNLISKLSGGVS